MIPTKQSMVCKQISSHKENMDWQFSIVKISQFPCLVWRVILYSFFLSEFLWNALKTSDISYLSVRYYIFILNGVNREPWGFFLTQFLCICALHHNCFVKAQRSDSCQSHIPLSISFNPQKEMSWYRAETALCDAKEGKQSWCCFRVML